LPFTNTFPCISEYGGHNKTKVEKEEKRTRKPFKWGGEGKAQTKSMIKVKRIFGKFLFWADNSSFFETQVGYLPKRIYFIPFIE
jgi:hypothetical protein